MATGCLSVPKPIDIPGHDTFKGETYSTSSWPREPVDFRGKRVGVIGTGSSGVQSIPVIAKQAGHLTVFQRTPQYAVPARHGNVDKAFLDDVKTRYEDIYEQCRWSLGGQPYTLKDRSALSVSDEEREAIYEEAWQEGGFKFILSSFNDISVDRRANDTASEYIRNKIRGMVHDPEVAEKLVPRDHPFTSKRALIDTNYFETYNRENVSLVDIRHAPIQEITAKGIRTEDEEYELDVIVFATGFDAMTGTFFKIDIQGREGLPLKEKWAEGPKTYLGLSTAGFPNMFMITGPGSPSVLSNMPVSIEQHVEFISDFIEYLRERDIAVAEPDAAAEEAWVAHVNEMANMTLYPLANSWYLGANIPGKPRVFMPYPGGVGPYRERCNAIAANDYEGYVLSAGSREEAPAAR
jgi:cyclohexanone monooxygenase